MSAFGTTVIDGIEVPAPPCEPCIFYNRCKTNRLACEKFLLYAKVRNGNKGEYPRRIPTREMYYDVFPNEEREDVCNQIL